MPVTIKLKNGSGSDPSASDLVVGELAIRTDSGKLFTKKDNGSVAEISGGSGTGLDDGDKGDITVSNGGDTFTIDSGVIDNANIASNAAIAGSKISPTFTSDLTVEHAGHPTILIHDTSGDNQSRIQFQTDSYSWVAGLHGGNAQWKVSNSSAFGTNDYLSIDTNGNLNIHNNITLGGTVDGRDLATDGTKLDGIEASATADQTASEIRALVESASDSNVFTDADHSKLNGIEASATADQSASEILTLLKTVDGTGSGLDADTLDGVQGSGYLNTGSSTQRKEGTLRVGNSTHDIALSFDGTLASASVGHAASNDEGIFWHTDNGYGIYRTAGAWSGNYQQLKLKWLTGIILDGGTQYGLSGVRVNSDFLPLTDSDRDIGSNSLRFANGYFDTLYGNGSNLTNLPSQTDQNFTNADHSKLDGIEAGATADQTAAEIRTLVGNASDSNVFTDALLSKLNGIAASATNVTNNNQLTNGAGYITATLTNEQVQDIVGGMVSSNTESGITVTYQDSDGTLDFSVASQTDNNFTNADHSKLDGIESGATADQTNSEIKTAYEANSNTNAFTDALLSKLNGIAASATNVTNNNQLTNGAGYITATLTNEQVQDIVGGMVSSNTESGITVTYQDSDGTLDFSVASQTDQNFTTALKNKLDGIATSATNVTNNNQLTNGAGYITTATVAGGCVYENSQTISSNYTVTNGKNAMSAGPISIADGVTVTIGDGETYTII